MGTIIIAYLYSWYISFFLNRKKRKKEDKKRVWYELLATSFFLTGSFPRVDFNKETTSIKMIE